MPANDQPALEPSRRLTVISSGFLRGWHVRKLYLAQYRPVRGHKLPHGGARDPRGRAIALRWDRETGTPKAQPVKIERPTI